MISKPIVADDLEADAVDRCVVLADVVHEGAAALHLLHGGFQGGDVGLGGIQGDDMGSGHRTGLLVGGAVDDQGSCRHGPRPVEQVVTAGGEHDLVGVTVALGEELQHIARRANGVEPGGVLVDDVLHLEHGVGEFVVRLTDALNLDVILGGEHAGTGACGRADGQRE